MTLGNDLAPPGRECAAANGGPLLEHQEDVKLATGVGAPELLA